MYVLLMLLAIYMPVTNNDMLCLCKLSEYVYTKSRYAYEIDRSGMAMVGSPMPDECQSDTHAASFVASNLYHRLGPDWPCQWVEHSAPTTYTVYRPGILSHPISPACRQNLDLHYWHPGKWCEEVTLEIWWFTCSPAGSIRPGVIFVLNFGEYINAFRLGSIYPQCARGLMGHSGVLIMR